jgi:hypothetical protein
MARLVSEGPGAAALEYLDEDEEVEDPPSIGVGRYFAGKGLNFFRYFAGKGAKFRGNFAEISKFR